MNPDWTSSTITERFWKYVDRRTEQECWNWTGATVPYKKGISPHRRGMMNVGYKFGVPRGEYAYRVSWQIHHGDVPEGMLVCHKCDNPLCVNPNHLFLGTHKDNLDDCYAKGRGIGQRFATDDRLIPSKFKKLSPSEVESIHAEHQSGKSMTLIAEAYDVSLSLISRIVRGERRATTRMVSEKTRLYTEKYKRGKTGWRKQ